MQTLPCAFETAIEMISHKPGEIQNQHLNNPILSCTRGFDPQNAAEHRKMFSQIPPGSHLLFCSALQYSAAE